MYARQNTSVYLVDHEFAHPGVSLPTIGINSIIQSKKIFTIVGFIEAIEEGESFMFTVRVRFLAPSGKLLPLLRSMPSAKSGVIRIVKCLQV